MADGGQQGDQGGGDEIKSVLFADIVDSTGFYDRMGDEAARRVIVQCLELMEGIAREHGGRPESRIGDEILCTFEDADAAAAAAGQMQHKVSEGHAEGDLEVPMRIRIGFEHGPLTRTDDGLFGGTIHRASRFASLAKAGQILTSSATLALLNPIRQRMERHYDQVEVRGFADLCDVHELLWDTRATVMTLPGKRRTRTVSTLAVELSYGDQRVRVDASRPRATLGRDSTCNLQLVGNRVSRLHARVVWNRGKVEVEDVSTNGTCVQSACGASQVLHHDKGEIQGEGVLRCGCVGDAEDSALVEFACESGPDDA